MHPSEFYQLITTLALRHEDEHPDAGDGCISSCCSTVIFRSTIILRSTVILRYLVNWLCEHWLTVDLNCNNKMDLQKNL